MPRFQTQVYLTADLSHAAKMFSSCFCFCSMEQILGYIMIEVSEEGIINSTPFLYPNLNKLRNKMK